MLYARDYAPGEALLNLLLERDDVRELSVTRADLCRKAEELLGLRLDFEYYHVAYLENRPPEPAGRLEIRTPSVELAGVIADHYEYLNEEQVIAHIRRGHLFGGFLGDKLVGFIGEHPEGSIGILEVLPEFRRHGYAYDLESFMIDRHFNQGKIPLCPDLHRQRKIPLPAAQAGYDPGRTVLLLAGPALTVHHKKEPAPLHGSAGFSVLYGVIPRPGRRYPDLLPGRVLPAPAGRCIPPACPVPGSPGRWSCPGSPRP